MRGEIGNQLVDPGEAPAEGRQREARTLSLPFRAEDGDLGLPAALVVEATAAVDAEETGAITAAVPHPGEEIGAAKGRASRAGEARHAGYDHAAIAPAVLELGHVPVAGAAVLDDELDQELETGAADLDRLPVGRDDR